VVVAFGDSLTSGIGEAAAQPYTVFLEEKLRHAGHPCRVVNQGLPGDTAAKGLRRVDAILQQQPTVVILALGGNDGLHVRDVAEIEKDLDSIVDALVRARVDVVVAGVDLPARYERGYAVQFHEMYARLAARRHLPLIPSLVEGLTGGGLVQGDGIHPTIAGNERMAGNVERILVRSLP
jgi:acyl-CoA thioesterase-1